MMKYRVVECSSSSELQFRVQQHIDEGWVPQGGVAVYFMANRSNTVYVQAMVLQQ